MKKSLFALLGILALSCAQPTTSAVDPQSGGDARAAVNFLVGDYVTPDGVAIENDFDYPYPGKSTVGIRFDLYKYLVNGKRVTKVEAEVWSSANGKDDLYVDELSGYIVPSSTVMHYTLWFDPSWFTDTGIFNIDLWAYNEDGSRRSIGYENRFIDGGPALSTSGANVALRVVGESNVKGAAYPAKNLVNSVWSKTFGPTEDRWETGNAPGSGAWVTIDLGRYYDVSKVTLRHYNVNKDFEVFVSKSKDFSRSTSIGRVTNNTAPATAQFTSQVARYVHVKIHSPELGTRASLREVLVY